MGDGSGAAAPAEGAPAGGADAAGKGTAGAAEGRGGAAAGGAGAAAAGAARAAGREATESRTSPSARGRPESPFAGAVGMQSSDLYPRVQGIARVRKPEPKYQDVRSTHGLPTSQARNTNRARARRGRQTCRPWSAGPAARMRAVKSPRRPRQRTCGRGQQGAGPRGPASANGSRPLSVRSATNTTAACPVTPLDGTRTAEGMEYGRPRQTPVVTESSGRQASRPPSRRGRERPHNGRRPPRGRSASGPVGEQYPAGRPRKGGGRWRRRSGTSRRSRSRRAASRPQPGRGRPKATT